MAKKCQDWPAPCRCQTAQAADHGHRTHHGHHDRQRARGQEEIHVVYSDNLALHQVEPAHLGIAVLGEQEDAQGGGDDIGAAQASLGQAAPPPVQM